MKIRRRTTGKRLLALFLAVAMTVGSVTVAAPEQAEANDLVTKASDFAKGTTTKVVKKALIASMDQMKDQTDSDLVILNFVEKRLKSPGQQLAEKVIASMQVMCQQILGELDKIDAVLDNLEAQNTEIKLKLDQLGINNSTDFMREFSENYKNVADHYKDLITYTKSYEENQSEDDLKKIKEANDFLERFYDSVTNGGGGMNYTYDFMDDIKSYSRVTSIYQSSDKLQEVDEFVRQPIGSQTEMTYLEAIQKYYEDKTSSQAMMYEAMSTNLNYAIIPLYYYLFDLQLYTSMRVNKINKDESLSRTEKDKELETAWNQYEAGQNNVWNIINQMCCANAEYINSLMRPYDTRPTKVTLNVQNERKHYVYENSDGNTITAKYDLKATELTKDLSYLEYSLLKLRDGNLYGIMVDTQGNKTVTLRDLHEEFKQLGNTDTVVSCDYLNLMNGSGAWGKFKLIKSASELKNVTSKSAYTGTDFWKYLKETENIPGLLENHDKVDPFYGVTSTFYDDWATAGTDADVDFYTIKNVSKEDPAKATKRLDLENDIRDHEDVDQKPAAFIMKLEKGAEVPMQMELQQDAGVQTTFEKASSDTKETIAADKGKENIYTINAGEVLNINVKVDSGKKIKNAILYGENTLGEWEPLEKFIEETDDQYLLDYCEQNDDGSYTIATLPMTYRSARLCIEVSEDDRAASHSVTLEQPEGDSRIQFSGFPGISSKSFETGSTVQMIVLPEDGKIPDGITVKDMDGKELMNVAVAQADIENDQILPEGAVVYSFSMPDQDVRVSMNQTQGYTVYLSEDENGSLVFTDEGGNEKNITGNVGTFRSGERVYVRGVSDKKDYYCENIVARNDGGSGAALQIRTEEEGISFQMPTNDVIVTGTFSQKKNCEVNVQLQGNNGAVGRIQLDGNNTTKKTYATGEKVTVSVIPQEGSWLESYAVKRTVSGTELPSTRTDSKASNGSEITFTMPAQNVTVDVVLDTGCANVYTGKLSVEAGLSTTLTEAQDGTERNVIEDLQEGNVSFGGKDQATYALQIKATTAGAVPQVIYSGNSGNKTLKGSWKNDTYLCEIGIPTEDFMVTVQNVGTRPEVDYDYLIPDYDTLCMYRDLINSDTTGTYKNATYLVTQDFSCPKGAEFEAIESFSGTLDGGGHTIKGLVIEKMQWPCALVITLNGCIKNLNFENVRVQNVTVYDGYNAGVPVATFAISMQENAVIENCTVFGGSELVGGPIGGIAVNVEKGATIRNCGIEALFSGYEQRVEEGQFGGIAVYSDGNIENCYFTGYINLGDGGGYRRNIVAGICAGSYQNGGGKIWNCYVGDEFYDKNMVPIEFRNNTVYEIGTGSSISDCYVSAETQKTLKGYADDQKLTYTPDKNVIYIATTADMQTNKFAQMLTDNIKNHETYQSWKQDDSENKGYPQFANLSVRSMYSASIVSNETASVQLQHGNDAATDKISNVPDGTQINVTGTAKSEKVQVKVRSTDSGKVVKEMECTPDENGSFATSFLMPACDVTVEAEEYKLHTGAISLTVDSIPSGKAKASLQNAEGTEIDRAELTETVYVNVDELDEKEYKLSGILVKSTAMNAPYQVYMDLDSIRQKDGRYAVSIDGDAEKLVRGIIGIYLVLEKNVYTIQTEAKPEGLGVITSDKESAVCGEDVSFEATAMRGYYCTSVVLCNKDGQYLQTLKMSNQSKGTFKMRSEDVIIRANFETIARKHDIYTKNSEQLTLSVTDRYGTRIDRSVTGSVVNVHYQKDAFSAAERISLYNASTYGKTDAKPLESWTADKTSDDLSGGISFTMPNCDVILVSKPLDEDSYKLTKEIEGEGRLFVKDTVTGTKENANQGEKIFVSACADRGWTLDETKTQILDAKGKSVKLDVAKHEHFVTFDMPAQDLVLKAVFTQNNYKITVVPPAKGTITVVDKNGQEVDLDKVHYQDQLTIKVSGVSLDSVKYMPENGEEDQEREILLDENGEAQFIMPEANITLYAGAESDENKAKTYEISTIEDLQKAIEIVKTEPDANFKLMNNLRCDNVTFTESIGSDSNPYRGTFDGQGYYIFKFNIDRKDGDAALFGTIGKKGTVKRLGIFYDKTAGTRAATIAVINEGMIDECVSGSNVSGTFNEDTSKKRFTLAELNTYVTGTEMAGGIVVENHGTIQNTASYTRVKAKNADAIVGGIAAVNSGTIVNCFSRGSIQEEEAKTKAAGSRTGGIVGLNEADGEIQIVYCAATTINGSGSGAIYGENSGKAENVFYLDELENGREQGTALTKQQMKKEGFLTSLNTLVKGHPDLRDWYMDQDVNSGYPTLTSSCFVQKELYDRQKGVSVKGMMHKDAKLSTKELDSKGEIYQAFEAYAKEKGMSIRLAAEPSLIYENGEYADYIGKLQLGIDASQYAGKGYKILIYKDGKVKEVNMDGLTYANWETEELPPFAVISAEDGKGNGPAGGNHTSLINRIKQAKTGDGAQILLWGGLLLAAAIALYAISRYRRKRKTEE